jgi:hypothetical protein
MSWWVKSIRSRVTAQPGDIIKINNEVELIHATTS